MALIRATEEAIFVGAQKKIWKVTENGSEPIFDLETIESKFLTEASDENKKEQQAGSPQVLCLATGDGHRIAVGTSEKILHVLDTESLAVIVSHRLPKAPTTCVFDKHQDWIIVGDRSGDIHRYEITNPGRSEELSGTISMVLDVAITEDGRKLISADRDEKVRISMYPKAFVIEAFCLGHTEYVKTLATIGERLWSAGGDKTVKEWDMKTGGLLKQTAQISAEKPIRKIVVNSKEKLLVSIQGDSTGKLLETDTLAMNDVTFDSEIVDLAAVNEDFVVLTRSSVWIVSSESRQIELPSELVKDLEESKDFIDSFFKNVAHNNKEEYEKRKQEKFAKLEEKKALKRKHEESIK